MNRRQTLPDHPQSAQDAPGTAPASFYPREGNPSWRGDCDGDRDTDIVDALFAARAGAGLLQPGTPVLAGIRRARDHYLRWGRDELGWALYLFQLP